ncbi:hypothetical protein [Peptostreptococcus canis]|uniref:Phage protein n=1 Tax=Peptostreptococcus canis TaxID=1159213 RepID=A0ABR6TMC2_9FIRM|nr:hypothetical protein [Peptostreptococcus canis]MBC2576557.1 hypothetical protein [Peptostreptococcus canis]MBP1998744.1 hypothetical protein [Peptostreptococcus canis]
MSEVIKYPIDKVMSIIREFYEDNEILKVFGGEAIQYDDEIIDDVVNAMCEIIDVINEENDFGR